MSHRCIKCQTVDGPTSSGFGRGPIVDGVPTPIPETTCTLCKGPVSVDADAFHAIGEAVERIHAVAAISHSKPFNVLAAARERVRELKRLLRQAKAWQSEHDQLARLLKASKPATVHALKVAR